MKISGFVILILFSINNTGICQTRLSFEFSGGIPYNLPAYINIHQNGFNDLKISNAKFYSEPFDLPPYWDWRFSLNNKNSIYELEAIHHKLYLKNKPDEIARFSISHGFNMFFINYGKIDDLHVNSKDMNTNFIYKLGIGAVFAHPETNIRGYSFEDSGDFLSTNYYLCGPAVNLSLGKRWYVLKRLYFNTEIKFTSAYVKIPIAQGHATVFTSTIQFIAGLGFDFISKE